MQTSDPKELIDLLQKKTLRIRTGIWLMPISMLGKESDHAARMNIDAVDVRDVLLENLPKDTRYLGLNANRVMQLVQEISDQFPGSECLLVYNLDLLLSKLAHTEISHVWQHLYDSFPNRRHALIVSMPENATHLLPDFVSMKSWNKDKRLSSTRPKEI